MRRHTFTRFAEALPAAVLAACSGPQSPLDAGSDEAAGIAILSWVMFAAAGLILVAVLALAAAAARAPAEQPRWATREGWVVAAGLVFPIVMLSALLAWGLSITGGGGGASSPPAAFRIAVAGEQWWWRVTYLGPDGSALFSTANELRLPIGQRVEVDLTSADVIHSFWVPGLAGKLDMIPGHVNTLPLVAGRAGTWRGQCAEYCGGAHALMAFTVTALPAPDFERWMAAQAAPAAEPDNAEGRRGRALFLASGCGACHAVRGTPASGTIGPDLTHVGGRPTIGAGLLPTQRGTLAAWIVDPGHLKPEVRMPPFPVFRGEDLRALAAWLESLR
ncbi:c-type cytochrome [Magnetospirillum sp. UT-4]|uniref:c-type cytochrome n=1 Tax=Magnetospirillum sp. UT-4 TaxID=2681467 RepID=UPI00138597A9|nr:c-type cytochrome [Magnetospirillum sp. UT-4]CAA7612897.1 Cytochrome c oxidase, subunit II [Magnetospirillum sp. UT-4]